MTVSPNPCFLYDITDVDQALIQEFDCISSKSTMTEYLVDNIAKQYHKKGEAITKVLIDSQANCIVGYFSLKCSCLQWEYKDRYTGKDSKESFPAIEISRFAIDQKYQGKHCLISGYEDTKYSEYLFDNVMDSIVSIHYYTGISAIILFSVDEGKPLSFYRRLGFSEIEGDYTVYETTNNVGCIPMYKFISKPENLDV